MGAHKDSKRIRYIKSYITNIFLFLHKPLQHSELCVIERRLIALQEAIRANAVVYHEKRVRMKAMRRQHDRNTPVNLFREGNVPQIPIQGNGKFKPWICTRLIAVAANYLTHNSCFLLTNRNLHLTRGTSGSAHMLEEKSISVTIQFGQTRIRLAESHK